MNPSSSEKQLIGFGCLTLIVATPIIIMLRGFALNVLWGWFITPLSGIAAPGVALCLGLALIVSYAVGDESSSSKDDKEITDVQDFLGRVCNIVLNPLARVGGALLFGWIVHYYV